jgi:glycosyltransferase involved in cell wall biosynthesis
MPNESPPRPALAVISNSCPPYRLHYLLRIARELHEMKLFSVFTHEAGSAAWAHDAPAEINPVMFGAGEPADAGGDLGRALHEWRKGGRIIRWMKHNDVRAAVVHGYNNAGLMRILRWGHRHNVPCLLHADSNIRGDLAQGIRAIVKRRLVSQAIHWSRTVLPCGTLGAQYFQKYGAKPEQIFLMPVEPDYDLIERVGPAQIEQTRERFKLPADRKRLVYSGRLAPVKRVDLLIDAFAQIAGDRPEWDLLILGDGPLRQALQARVPEGLRARVTWAGFIGDQTVVSALYRACDVLVLPSDYEPWALVINEAAAAGLAIVASDVVGAAPELVKGGVNGCIFPRGDLPQLVECLIRVTDPSNVEPMKRGSADVLRDWRVRADPIAGLRAALQSCGVIEGGPV